MQWKILQKFLTVCACVCVCESVGEAWHRARALSPIGQMYQDYKAAKPELMKFIFTYNLSLVFLYNKWHNTEFYVAYIDSCVNESADFVINFKAKIVLLQLRLK